MGRELWIEAGALALECPLAVLVAAAPMLAMCGSRQAGWICASRRSAAMIGCTGTPWGCSSQASCTIAVLSGPTKNAPAAQH